MYILNTYLCTYSCIMYTCVMSEHNDSAESNIILRAANPQYENVPAPPQLVLSLKECAAYGVVKITSNN